MQVTFRCSEDNAFIDCLRILVNIWLMSSMVNENQCSKIVIAVGKFNLLLRERREIENLIELNLFLLFSKIKFTTH